MIDYLYRAAASLFSPAGENARLSILIYHRVLEEVDELFPSEVTAELFDRQLDALKNVFNVLPLSEAITRLKLGTLPARAACITFDDGYADNFTLALPVLQKHNLKATFFIATAYLNGGRMFNDTVIHAIRHSRDDQIDLSILDLGTHDLATPEAKRAAIGKILRKVKYLPLGQREETVAEIARLSTDMPLPDDLMMNAHQLKALAESGMEIGGHTARHPILAKLDEAAVLKEIAEGKDYLEGLLAIKLKSFAYPNGVPGQDYLVEQALLPKKLGFEAAVSTQSGAANRRTDVFQLPRFTPWNPNISRFNPMLIRNLIG
jgi:peptidoglycan/xylan/chitin deacetylase (PgdA/CDA1 family)